MIPSLLHCVYVGSYPNIHIRLQLLFSTMYVLYIYCVHILCIILHCTCTCIGAKANKELGGESGSSEEERGAMCVEDGVDQDEVVLVETAEEEFSSAFTSTKPSLSTAESILFPIEEEGLSDEEEEESDWIVSSEEDDTGQEIEDVKEVLAQLRKAPQPIMYHFEAGCKETDDFIMEDQEDGGDVVLTEEDGRGCGHRLLQLHGVLREMSGERGRERGGEGEKEGELGGDGDGETELLSRSTAATRLKQLLPEMKEQLESVDSHGKTVCQSACY